MERKGLLDEGSTLSEVANKLKKKKSKNPYWESENI